MRGNYPIDESADADDWVYWVSTVVAIGDRFVVGDTWCDRLDEVVAMQLVDRLVLAGRKTVDVGDSEK